MDKKRKYTLKDAEKVLILRSWWSSVCVLPIANRIVVFLANYTGVKPNTVTVLSAVLRVFSGLFFLGEGYLSLAIGAALYYFAYLFDCVDGPLARLKKETSLFGRYFDHMSDLSGGVFVLITLAVGQKMLLSPVILGMIVMQVSEYYITFLANLAAEKGPGDKIALPFFKRNFLIKKFLSYRDIFFKDNFKSFLSLPDYEALVFIVFPLVNQPVAGIRIGFYFLAGILTYKIFSSFISLEIGEKKFP